MQFRSVTLDRCHCVHLLPKISLLISQLEVKTRAQGNFTTGLRRKFMKRLVLMALLALGLPLMAFANSVNFNNIGGTLSGSSAGLTLTLSTLSSINDLNGVTTGNLGTFTFSTAAL